MGLIETDAILASLRESRDRANVWLSDCLEYGSNMTERAEQKVMTFNECILRVKGAPTVDAVPVVHGRWKEDPSGYGFWICSACGFVSEASAANMLYKFCPHCGKYMTNHQMEDEEDV